MVKPLTKQRYRREDLTFSYTIPLAALRDKSIGAGEVRMMRFVRCIRDERKRKGLSQPSFIEMERKEVIKTLGISQSLYYRNRKKCKEKKLETLITSKGATQVPFRSPELGLEEGKGFVPFFEVYSPGSRIKITCEVILSILCSLVDNEEGWVNVSNKLLANLLNCSLSTIKRRMGELHHSGRIRIQSTMVRKPLGGLLRSSNSTKPHTIRCIQVLVEKSRFYKLNHHLSNIYLNNTTTKGKETRGEESGKKGEVFFSHKEIFKKCETVREGLRKSIKYLRMDLSSLSEHQLHILNQAGEATEGIYKAFKKPINNREAFIYKVFCKQLINNVSRRIFSYRKDLSHALLTQGYTSALEGVKDSYGRLIDFYKEDTLWEGLNVSMKKALEKYSPILMKYYKCPLEYVYSLLKDYESTSISLILKEVYKEGIENMWNMGICIFKIASKVLGKASPLTTSFPASVEAVPSSTKGIASHDREPSHKTQHKISLQTREYIGNYLGNFDAKNFFWNWEEGKLFKRGMLHLGHSWEMSLAVTLESPDEEWKPYITLYKKLAGLA